MKSQIEIIKQLTKALRELDTMSRGIDWCDSEEHARRWQQGRLAIEASDRYMESIGERTPPA